MSSSNRTALPCEAILYRGDQSLGPMRLPLARKSDFVEEFNRIYAVSNMVAKRETADRTERKSSD